MPKSLPPVEAGNALPVKEYRKKFIPQLLNDYTFESPKSSSKYRISLESSSSITSADLDACYNLIVDTSEENYAHSSMGWRPKQKRKEMKLPDMRYLLVRTSTDSLPEGFASFMLTYEDGDEVVYLYEIHLQESLRGTGLGKKLMSFVEEVGQVAGMAMAMLTVFKNNADARKFYDGLDYSLDKFSPGAKILRNGVVKECDYEILSKVLLPKAQTRG